MSSHGGATPGARRPSYFLLRKLHSLSGVIPIGVFLCMHLATNASILGGPQTFQNNVDRIHSLEPFLVPVEVLGIFLPIGFHATLGIQIWRTSRSNTGAYPFGANIRYRLQRLTGIIALAFILLHLWHMHWLGKPFGGGFFDPHSPNASYTATHAIERSLFYPPVYALGITAACYHFANGLWTFLISWGVTVGRNAQRKAGYVCAAIGIGIWALGMTALWRFSSAPADSMKIEPPAHVADNPPEDGTDG